VIGGPAQELRVNDGAERGQARRVHTVVNHLHLRIPDSEAARDGGPWMNKHVRPLLPRDTERSVGEVVAAAAR
jgi:hypothetical protein